MLLSLKFPTHPCFLKSQSVTLRYTAIEKPLECILENNIHPEKREYSVVEREEKLPLAFVNNL